MSPVYRNGKQGVYGPSCNRLDGNSRVCHNVHKFASLTGLVSNFNNRSATRANWILNHNILHVIYTNISDKEHDWLKLLILGTYLVVYIVSVNGIFLILQYNDVLSSRII